SKDSTTRPKNYFVRYNNVRTQLHTLLQDNNLIYGLHFANKVDTNSITQGSNVMINGKKYDSYDFVNSSINFNLSNSGYMTAVFGGYETNASNNQYAFSLYQIDRNNNVSGKSTINSIVEITSVWVNDDDSNDILYSKTSNITTSEGVEKYTEDDKTYSKVYDKDWYNKSSSSYGNIEAGTAYYVEIPLTAGDYCLGGVGDWYSAYLMYLDIGANGSSSGSEIKYGISGVKFVYAVGDIKNTLDELFTFQIVNATKITGNWSSVLLEVYFCQVKDDTTYYTVVVTSTNNVTINPSNANSKGGVAVDNDETNVNNTALNSWVSTATS
ncbi:MAG: hypothetical protein ACI4GX_03560, partial [Ruminococcus sp.]